jgi:excisionase family DNA binding protein
MPLTELPESISMGDAEMADLLTTRELQDLIKVDRSTIYRMAEAGHIPAVKVGRQWRFPAAAIEEWLGQRTSQAPPRRSAEAGAGIAELVDPFPADCVQHVTDLIADIFGVMVLVTDLEGHPLTRPSNPCGLFDAINEVPDGVPRCIAGWKDLASSLDLETKFLPSPLGLLCARSFIRAGSELRAMVIVGGIAPAVWPPDDAEIDRLAAEFGLASDEFRRRAQDVFHVPEERRWEILAVLPRVGLILSEITRDRGSLLGKLEAIAAIVGAPASNQGAIR